MSLLTMFFLAATSRMQTTAECAVYSGFCGGTLLQFDFSTVPES